MKRTITLVFIMTFILSAKDYTKNPITIEFMDALVQTYDFKRADLEKLFSNVKVQKSALRVFLPKVKKKRTPEQIAVLKNAIQNMVHGIVMQNIKSVKHVFKKV